MTPPTVALLVAGAIVAGFLARKIYVYFFPHHWRAQTPQQRRHNADRKKKQLLASLTLGTGREGMFH